MTKPQFVAYPYPKGIDKDALKALPKAKCLVPIHVIDKAEQVAPAVQRLQQYGIIGLDTETKPSFVPGKRNQVALLQLSTTEECFLFRLNRIGMPRELVGLLESPGILKIGLSLGDDCRSLARLGQFEAKGFVELQQLAPAYGMLEAASLQKIYAIMFGEYISKSQRMSNWEARNLKPEQESYAALDAWASLRIYLRLMEHPQPHPAQFALLHD